MTSVDAAFAGRCVAYENAFRNSDEMPLISNAFKSFLAPHFPAIIARCASGAIFRPLKGLSANKKACAFDVWRLPGLPAFLFHAQLLSGAFAACLQMDDVHALGQPTRREAPLVRAGLRLLCEAKAYSAGDVGKK